MKRSSVFCILFLVFLTGAADSDFAQSGNSNTNICEIDAQEVDEGDLDFAKVATKIPNRKADTFLDFSKSRPCDDCWPKPWVPYEDPHAGRNIKTKGAGIINVLGLRGERREHFFGNNQHMIAEETSEFNTVETWVFFNKDNKHPGWLELRNNNQNGPCHPDENAPIVTNLGYCQTFFDDGKSWVAQCIGDGLAWGWNPPPELPPAQICKLPRWYVLVYFLQKDGTADNGSDIHLLGKPVMLNPLLARSERPSMLQMTRTQLPDGSWEISGTFRLDGATVDTLMPTQKLVSTPNLKGNMGQVLVVPPLRSCLEKGISRQTATLVVFLTK